MATNWFYADAHNQQQGPVDSAWLANAYRTGVVKPDTLVWRESQANWLPLRQVAAQIGVIIGGGAMPPPPPRGAIGGGQRMVKPSGSSSSAALIVVVVIIGLIAVMAILAAIALPAYQDYTTRSKVMEGAILADGVKLQVAEFRESNKQCPHNSDEGFNKPQEYAARYVSSIDVGTDRSSGGCAVQVTFTNIPSIEGKQLRYILKDDGSWRITTDVPAKYLSTSMRDRVEH